MENLGNSEENLGIPEDLRCKRSDGKQWRCTAMSMPDKTVCEKHYIQAKRRAANSALRASMKKAQKRAVCDDGDMFLDNQDDEFDDPVSINSRDGDYLSQKKSSERISRDQVGYSSETSMRGISMHQSAEEGDEYANEANHRPRTKLQYPSMESSRNKRPGGCDSNGAEYSDDILTESSEDVGAQPCHQCNKRSKNGVIWCLKCDRRGYCVNCVSERYPEMSLEELGKCCPGCRGICYCRTCLRTDNTIKVRIREIPVIDKLQYLYCILSAVLPVLKKIHHDQCTELELEKKIRGDEIDLLRTKLNADEQMCCNICRMPIVDYHRHCPNCTYDACLQCCQDLRATANYSGNHIDDNMHDSQSLNERPKLDMPVDFPAWRVNSDGSIPCPPTQHGGCGCSSLSLCRIFKMNWVAKLVKNSHEMVSGCRLTGDTALDSATTTSAADFEIASSLFRPSFDDLKGEGIRIFRKHWSNGEPIIVTGVFESSATSSWDPSILSKEIRQTSDQTPKHQNTIVNATDCSTGFEIEIELAEFVRGYSEGLPSENGTPKLLKLKDWPSPIASEEFLLYQRPDFYSRVPLLEYIHSKLGVLNVAAKLPHYSLQNDAGPKIYLSYGADQESGDGDAATHLISKMRDMVYILMHTTVKRANCQTADDTATSSASNSAETTRNDADFAAVEDEDRRSKSGVSWDVFRREDALKLMEFLQKVTVDSESASHALYNGSLYLNSDQKRELKQDLGVEAWSFEQRVGQAVFVPAGCPFQARNLQSTVQLGLDFLSPESLPHAVKLGDEIRALPGGSEAKAQVLEVGKISVYAASSAIKEIQKLILDPRLAAEIGFDDPNLTAAVSAHLEMVVKRNQLSCP